MLHLNMNLKGSLAKLKPSKPINTGTIALLLFSVVFLVAYILVVQNNPAGTNDNIKSILGIGFLLILSFAYMSYRGPKTHSSIELSTTPHTSEERTQILHKHVILEASNGWRVEVETEFEAVLSKGHRVNHILHLLISVVTLGLWIIPWIFISLLSGEKRETISVDDFGNTRIS